MKENDSLGVPDDAKVCVGLTEKTASHFLTSCSATIRAFNSSGNLVEILKTASAMLDQQRDHIENVQRTETQAYANAIAKNALISVGMAMASITDISPNSLVQLMGCAIASINEVAGRVGMDDLNSGVFVFDVKMTGGGAEQKVAVHLNLIPTKDRGKFKDLEGKDLVDGLMEKMKKVDPEPPAKPPQP